MNPVQFAQQIKHRLQAAVWPGTYGAVFGARGGVAVYAGAPTQEQIPPGFPWALVGIEGGEFDADHPDYLVGKFSVTIGAQGFGDRMAEFAVIGGPVGSGNGNRGLAEISAVARGAVSALTGADGAAVVLSGQSMSPPTSVGPNRHLCMEKFDLAALCTSAASFDSPQRLRHVGTKWLWDGAHCTSRFDFVEFALVSKQGLIPSADLSDGTIVYQGADVEWTGAQSSGRCYTCFAGYGSRGGGVVEFYSPVVVGSYRQPT